MTENYYILKKNNTNIYISTNMPLYLLSNYLISHFKSKKFDLIKINYKEYCKNVNNCKKVVYRNFYI